jgi:hypothetical protein
MSEFDFLSHEVEPDIPTRCEACPVEPGLRILLTALYLQQDELTGTAKNLVGDKGYEVDKNFEERFSPLEAEQLKTDIRCAVANQLNELDAKIEQTTQQIIKNADSCRGILWLVDKHDGIEYAAGICTSANMHLQGEDAKSMQAFIKRSDFPNNKYSNLLRIKTTSYHKK